MVDFKGKVVALVGRLGSMSHRMATAEIARRGGSARRGLARGADMAIVGHGAHILLRSGRLERMLIKADALRLDCLSENAFLAAVEVGSPPETTNRTIPLEVLARQAGLDARTARFLALFDVIEPVEGNCGFQDLVAAKEVARLCAENVALADIVAGAAELGPGAHLSEVRLARTSSGAVVMQIGNGYAELDGQLRLPLPDAGNPTADELFEAAEIAEDAADWVAAERHYRRALDLDDGDQSAAFNLANTLAAQDRGAEAQIYLRRALAIDPDFAEAWYNLAGFLDAAADRAAAKESLEKALAIDGDYADALYNLGQLHFEDGAYERALECWERYLSFDPQSEWGEKARRAMAVCRRRAKPGH
jgi:hypothetical protein